MTPVPFELPIRPSEAVELADLVFDHAGRRLNDDLRSRLAGRATALRLDTVTPWFGSLERDPVHPDTFYLAVDAAGGVPLLLHMALASAPASGLYAKALLLGRMRSAADREVVVNAVPFGPGDRENISKYAERVNTEFLPRPQGTQSSLVVCGGDPGLVMPAAFETFRAIWKRTGKKLAAVAGRYHAALWAAIRAGWREGYSLESGGDSSELAVCTRFRAQLPLEAAAEAYEAVRRARAASRFGRSFDFELITTADATPEQVSALVENWKGRGYGLQSVFAEVASIEQAAALAAAVRRHQAVLSLQVEPDTPGELLEAVGRATLGRVQARLECKAADTREGVAERISEVARQLLG